MELNKKIKYLWGIPSYRLRLLFFVTLGAVAILASLIVKNSFWQDILSNFAVTFAAVGFIDFMWDILGGEPMEANMLVSFGEVNQKIDAINQSMTVVSDLLNNQIGIERIWPSRSYWHSDQIDGSLQWIQRVCQAKRVDIVSNTFSAWAKNPDFRKDLFKAIEKGTKFRLLIYDPDSSVLRDRSKHEKTTNMNLVEMQIEIKKTLILFSEERRTLSKKSKDNLKIRLTQEYYHPTQIIRADEKMLVTFYLAGKTGAPAPTIQILGSEAAYFKIYAEQFEILWNGLLDEVSKQPKVKELTEDDYQFYLSSD